ncbi:MAG TPA: hypothetical protein VHT05_14050 [Candidatus Elarobacter sp.]|nr:hypothetical protein [Candidatus Elarobacter sp.]
MRFTILAGPGSEPGDARSRAAGLVSVSGPREVAAAAWATTSSHLLLFAPGARPMPGAFGGLSSLGERIGVLGGAVHAGGARLFGWMLAPAELGPLPFEPVPIAAGATEAGVEAAIRGQVDVVAPGMTLVDRRLLLEPLPADPVAAMVELCARARTEKRDVVCRPSFACAAPALDLDDRGRAAALRAVSERRPELVGRRRMAGAKLFAVERELRLDGGRRVRARITVPPLCVLLHGSDAELATRRARELAPRTIVRAVADPVAALRAEMRVRGDRYVLVAGASSLPDPARFALLAETLESAPHVALAAPNAAALDGRCVLLALARFPQHVEARGATLAAAIASLADAARALRRAVRAPGYVPAHGLASPPRRASIVFVAGSQPEVARVTLDALIPAARADDEIVAVCAHSARTLRNVFAAYPQLRVVTDAGDPLLCTGLNRALGAAERELIVLVADDVLLPNGTLDRLRDAFERIPSLGAAFPAVPGAAGGEGVSDLHYADLTALQAVAERRRSDRARRIEPLDVAATPALAVARDALHAVGGIDPELGPTARGIAELVTRLRAAGYPVVRCDDALAHRFDPAQSHNPAAVASVQRLVAADPIRIAAGFDPATRVPFDDVPAPPMHVLRDDGARSHAVALPVAGIAELELAVTFLTAAAGAFGAGDPVRLHVLLDGDVSPADAVARVRPVLAATGRPLESTVAVRIERVEDLAAWRSACEDEQQLVVAAGHERDALDGVRPIAARALGRLIEPGA